MIALHPWKFKSSLNEIAMYALDMGFFFLRSYFDTFCATLLVPHFNLAHGL